jgi:hypothetical protein
MGVSLWEGSFFLFVFPLWICKKLEWRGLLRGFALTSFPARVGSAMFTYEQAGWCKECRGPSQSTPGQWAEDPPTQHSLFIKQWLLSPQSGSMKSGHNNTVSTDWERFGALIDLNHFSLTVLCLSTDNSLSSYQSFPSELSGVLTHRSLTIVLVILVFGFPVELLLALLPSPK